MNQLHLFEETASSLPKNFTIYRSSAGSGKTFTLVKEYLKIVLRNPLDYKHILAITFTNKATEEMKDRILESLMEMASGKKTAMQEVIEDEVKHYPQKLNIQDRAQKALTNILHDYSRFSVSTIDHFFSQLVRALARELKLSLNYEIDVDDDTAMEESLELLYENLTHNEQLRNWTRDFAFSRIEDDKGWQLDYTLINFGKELFKEKFHQGFSQIDKQDVNIESLRELESFLQNTEKGYRNHMKDLARKAQNIISKHGLVKEDFKGRSTGVANTFDKILKNKLSLTATFKNVASGSGDWYAASSPKKDQIQAVVDAGLGQIARDILEYEKAHYSQYVTAKQLQKHIYSYGLLDAISEQLKIYRQSNNLMLLSHNSFLLREIISDKEAPFLFEKLGSQYHHVLIDEFQDTSAYQWENVKPLITNSLDQQNHVLLVGDVKQSIYRWRGGDLNLLLDRAVNDLNLYKDSLKEEALQKNRRSAPLVVDFNNRFFKLASQALLLTKNLPENSKMLSEVYKDVEQEWQGDSGGAVSIRFFERNDQLWREESLTEVTRVIKDHVQAGGRYGDCLVLCDKNAEVAEASQHLSLDNIPVDSDQALRLSSYWAVRLLISGMYLLVDPEEDLARAEMAFLYQRGALGKDMDFHSLFVASCKTRSGLLVGYLPEELVNGWDHFANLNIYEWVSQVVRLIIDSSQADPFISRFLEVCLEQNARGRTTARDFLEWWEENKEDQMVIFPSQQDAVRVMTIHKAKGLEAPIVLIPWADYELKPHNDTLFWTRALPAAYVPYKLLPLSFTSELMESQFAEAYQQELLEGLTEGLNTVYVAFTRARQQLYVYSVKPSRSLEIDDLGYLYKLLWQICNQPEWGASWDSQRSVLTIGDPATSLPESREEQNPSQSINQLRIADYHSKVTIRSGKDRMFTLLDHYKANNIREGIQVHMVLEHLKTQEDLPLVLTQMETEGVIKGDDVPTIAERIESLFELPQFSQFFDPTWEVLSEREIASQGKWYKPDRVMIKDDQAMVIDYKREQEDNKHHQQVNTYAGLLEQMGYTQVEKYLVYVGEVKIVQV